VNAPRLTEEQSLRYSRQLPLAGIGRAGQKRLLGSSALVVGAGGLGSPVLLYLAAAGVGRLGIVDPDQVEISNLQRQIMHDTRDLGRAKARSAADSVRRLNPHVQVDVHELPLTQVNAPSLVAPYDIVVDCSDSFAVRQASSQACVRLDKPCVYGSVFEYEGQASFFPPGGGPCYNCLFPESPAEPEEGGGHDISVFSPVPGVIGAVQASEALKHLLGFGENLIGRLLLFDSATMDFQMVRFRRDPHCSVCGGSNSEGEPST